MSTEEQTSLNMELRRRLGLLKHKKSPSTGSSQPPANQPTGQSTPSTIEYGSTRVSRSPDNTAQTASATSGAPTSTVPKSNGIGQPHHPSPRSKGIQGPSHTTNVGGSKVQAPSSQIPGLFLGSGASKSGRSELVKPNSSQRLNSNNTQQRQDEDDESDLEDGEVRTPKPGAAPSQPSRPNVLSRVNSINKSGTQTPNSTVLQLRRAEIEKAKAKLLEDIAKKEQNLKKKGDISLPKAAGTPPAQVPPASNPHPHQTFQPHPPSTTADTEPKLLESTVVPNDEGNKTLDPKKAAKLSNRALLEQLRSQIALVEKEVEQEALSAAEESSKPVEAFQSKDVLMTQKHVNSTDDPSKTETNPVPEAGVDGTTAHHKTTGRPTPVDDIHMPDEVSDDREEGELSESESTNKEAPNPTEAIGATSIAAHAPVVPSSEDESDNLYSAEDSMTQSHIVQPLNTISEHISPTNPDHIATEPQRSESAAGKLDDITLPPEVDIASPHTNTNETGEQSSSNGESSDSDGHDDDDMDDYEPNLELPQLGSTAVDTPPVLISDDLAPELQPQPSPFPSNSAVVRYAGCERSYLTVAQTSLPGKRKNIFTPYDSPLKKFKAYRYHPEYTSTVSTGFGSLTYCNKIIPDRPFCQFESDGGICNDPQCPGQHFRDIQLAG
jgi:hypothetical protein